jgi:LysR family hydrogen peroxide-inducible transcriptional activator
MPVLSVKPPVAVTENMALRPFQSPAPSRTIALAWRKSSPLGGLMKSLLPCLKKLPKGLLDT